MNKFEAMREQLKAGVQVVSAPQLFPTPEPLIKRMVDYAQIRDMQSVLEPSAGTGAIVDYIRYRFPLLANIGVYEINHGLQDILRNKGYCIIGGDFLDSVKYGYKGGPVKWDRIVMNPPFAKLQDIDHVLTAFELLDDGGRLVSIMSPAPFFRSIKKAEAFREWFLEQRGELIDLPPNSFKESGTGVASKLIILEKP